MNIPTVAVVILNWNGKKLLEQFLPSVVASTYTNASIYVADNASTDDSVQFVKQNFASVKIIQNTTNEGFAKGYNTALQSITEDYIVLLNSDVAVTPNWLQPMVVMLQNNDTLGICQPKILNQINTQQFDYAGASGGFIDKYGYPFARGRVMDNVENDNAQYDDEADIFWASGAALMVRNNIYKKLNGLDDSFFAHQEEIDFCWRTQLLGYKIMVCPQSVVYHVGGATLQQGSPQKTYLNFRNNLKMLYKNLPISQKLVIIPYRFFLDAIAAYRFLIKGEFAHYWAIAKAHYSFIVWIITIYKKDNLLKKPLNSLIGVIDTSIVYQFFIKNKKTFKEIFDKQL